MDHVAEITVKGYGSVSAVPDGICLDLTVKANKPDYSQTLDDLNERVRAVNAAIVRTGFSGKPVTKTYEISEEWTNPYETAKRAFAGFTASQVMSIALPLDMALLGSVIAELSQSNSNAELNISFVVQDTNAMEHDARIAAVTRAKQAAMDLAKASDLHLLAVKSINYAGNKANGRSRMHMVHESAAQYDVSSATEVSPDAIYHEETVTVVWLARPSSVH